MKLQILSALVAIVIIAPKVDASSEGYRKASKYMNVSADGGEVSKKQKRRVASNKSKKKSDKRKLKKQISAAVLHFIERADPNLVS